MQEVTEFINKGEIIKQVPLFSELNWLESWIILSKLSFFEYKKNEVVYSKGDPSDAFYFLMSGRLHLYKKAASGKVVALEYLTRGKYFGIISLLTGETHSVSVKVVNDALILKIIKKDFEQILKRIPKLAVHMSKSLSRRLRRKRLPDADVFQTKIIAVVSAKKDTLKSVYAANLAFSLKKETNKKVIFLDTSPQASVISQIKGSSEEAHLLDVTEASFDEKEIKKYVFNHDSGIDLLAIAYSQEGPNQKADITRLLNMLMENYHFIITDFPAGLNSMVSEILNQSDLIHIVTSDSKRDLVLTRKFLGSLKDSIKNIEENISVIVNEIGLKKMKFLNRRRDKLLGEKFYITLPGLVDRQVSRNFFLEVLACPHSEYARVIRNIARQTGEVLVGLALSGGAALGFAHIGVLKVLEKENISIDIVSGTSIGALIGALWSSGISAADVEKIALRFENKFRVLNLFDFTFPRLGLASGRNITRLLEKHLKGKTFHDLKIPFRAVACDLESRQDVIFDEGSVVKAVRASLSIPGVFVPLFYKGRFLMDGGILQPLPIQPLLRMGVSKIIAVNVLPSQLDVKKAYQKYQQEQERKMQAVKSNLLKKLFYKFKKRVRRIFFPNIFDAIVIAIQASEAVLAETTSKQADVCLHPDLSHINWFEFYRARELIKLGEEEARSFLPQIREIQGQNT